MSATWIAVVCGYTALLACVAGVFRIWAATRVLAQQSAQMERRAAQAALDRAFAIWASKTMLTVTNAQGYVQASTLRELYTSGYWDQVWDTPVAAAVWHAEPEVIDRFHAELTEEQRHAG